MCSYLCLGSREVGGGDRPEVPLTVALNPSPRGVGPKRAVPFTKGVAATNIKTD